MSLTTRNLSVDWGVSGLAPNLFFRVVDADNNVLLARSAAAVLEYPTGSGQYEAKVATWDTSWVGRVIWDDGTNYTSESFEAMPVTIDQALTESYRSTGATGSMAQLLYEILAHMGERTITGTTVTLKKLDGSTTAKTYTLDSASTPSSITETT